MAGRAFDDVTDTPCPVCLGLAMAGKIQARGVMPLPKFPPLLRRNNRECCHDCQAAETVMAMGGHPKFSASRLAVANDRIEGMLMPRGMMEVMGLCQMGYMRPCSFDDFPAYIRWLDQHGIPNSCEVKSFGLGDDDAGESLTPR